MPTFSSLSINFCQTTKLGVVNESKKHTDFTTNFLYVYMYILE